MERVGLLETAQEDADGGDAAQHPGARLGLRLFVERALVSDMHMRIEDPGKHRPSAGIEDVLGPCGKVVAERDDLATRDADVGVDRAHTRNDQRSACDDERILRSGPGVHSSSLTPGNRW